MKMKEELEVIINLMDKPINIDSLKQIKEMVEKKVNPKYVRSIEETHYITGAAEFLLSSRIILINYNNIKKYMEIAKETLKEDTRTNKNTEKKLIRLLSVYRILLHEMHHSKQIYNVFDTCEKDIETEIIKSIYNIDNEEYKNQIQNKDIYTIIEEKTAKINQILRPYSEINPIERKAEIESYKQIRELIKPVKNSYPNVYNEMEMQILSNMYNGYQNGVPYEQVLKIIKENNSKYTLPYNSKNINDFMNKIKDKLTEIERMELGLNVQENTIENTFNNLQKIYTLNKKI